MASKKIIVAYDKSPGSEKALELAADLAKAVSADLSVVSVIDSPLVAFELDNIATQKHALKAEGENTIAAGKKRGEELGVKVTGTVLEGNPADALIKYAQKENAYLIVVGSRGLGGFESLLLGSVAQALVTHSDIPVLVAK